MNFLENDKIDSHDRGDPFLPILGSFNSGETSVSSATQDCDSTSVISPWEKTSKGTNVVQQVDDFVYLIDVSRLTKPQEELFKKVVKSVGKDHCKAAKGEKRDRKTEVAEFLKQYSTGNFCDVPVASLRHIIPLLLMEVYSDVYGQFLAKVKGLWEKQPHDWDENVPFLDPNNNVKCDGKQGSKPTKDVLISMLTFLVKKYKVSIEKRTFPHQVEDTEDVDLGSKQRDQCRNPVRELVDRISLHLQELKNFTWASSYINDLRNNFDSLKSYTSESLLTRGHVLELFIDVLMRRRVLPSNWQYNLTNMQNVWEGTMAEEISNSFHSGTETQLQDKVWASGSGAECSSKSLNTSLGTGNESMENFFPHMNIKTRGDTEVLMSNVSWREEPSCSQGSSEPSCCAVDMQECHDDELLDVGDPCKNVDLSEIVENPDYNSGVLLDVLDSELASGEQELNVPDEIVDDGFVASQMGDQNYFNFQENYIANTSLVGFGNSGIVYVPESAADPVCPTSVVPESFLFGTTVNVDCGIPSSTNASYNRNHGGASEVLSQVHVESMKQMFGVDVNCMASPSLPIDQSRLTGPFQQMTLQNGGKVTLESHINTIIGIDSLVVQPPVNSFANCLTSSDYATQIPAQPQIACKRVAPIPVMVETAEDFEESSFTAPSQKRSRQSYARR